MTHLPQIIIKDGVPWKICPDAATGKIWHITTTPGEDAREIDRLTARIRKLEKQVSDSNHSLECLRRESSNRCKEAITERDVQIIRSAKQEDRAEKAEAELAIVQAAREADAAIIKAAMIERCAQLADSLPDHNGPELVAQAIRALKPSGDHLPTVGGLLGRAGD